jgi:hypothetical protein
MIKYSSNFPISILLGLLIDMFSLILFSYHMIFGQLPILYGLSYILICLILVEMIICRYSGKVIITDSHIQIKYFFPWYVNELIEISNIKKLETYTPSKKFHSNIYITLKDDSKKQISIQSWYKSMDGVKKIEVEYGKVKNK